MPEQPQKARSAAMTEDFKRGFLAGRRTCRASVDLTLEALDSLLGDGFTYEEARKLIDQMREGVSYVE